MTIDLRELAARLRTWGTGMQLAATTSTNTADAAEFARYARAMEAEAMWCEALVVFKPEFSPWRHGGWYVDNVRYPSGACGCVSRNYPDRKWRIACDNRPGDHTYPNREAAARAEYEITQRLRGSSNGQQ